MTNVLKWLEAHATGFRRLTPAQREAPMHFSLLWSYFEYVACGKDASYDVIEKWITNSYEQGQLDPAAFAGAIAHFKKRYVEDGRVNHHFDALHLSDKQRPKVEPVLIGERHDSVDSVVALFFIIYRLRNNYLHGVKWAYHLENQLENFTMANESIMAVLDVRE